MDFFSDSLGRLKHALRVSKDQEVAEALGLSKTAFSERKKRGAFPEENLRALAQQRPELGIDVVYVLTGGHLSAHQRQAIEGARAFTDALPTGAADKQHLRALNDQAELQTASTNASRADNYAQITELLAGSSDETVALVLQLVARLYLADLPKAARGGQR